MDVKNLFQPRHKEDLELNRTIIEPTNYELSLIKGFIDIFPDLISVDYVNEKFIALLGYFIGYDYLEYESSDVQREIMKRVLTIYKERGSIESLRNACKYGYSDNYVGSTMTYYKDTIIPSNFAVSYPRDSLFVYDKSKWDRGHRWQDMSEWMQGIIDINIEKFSSKTVESLENIIPAGIRYRISILRDMGGTDGLNYVRYPYEVETPDLWVEMNFKSPSVYVDSKWLGEGIFTYDKDRYDSKKRYSGIDRETGDVWDERQIKFDSYTRLLPSDIFYNVGKVENLRFIDNERLEPESV